MNYIGVCYSVAVSLPLIKVHEKVDGEDGLSDKLQEHGRV